MRAYVLFWVTHWDFVIVHISVEIVYILSDWKPLSNSNWTQSCVLTNNIHTWYYVAIVLYIYFGRYSSKDTRYIYFIRYLWMGRILVCYLAFKGNYVKTKKTLENNLTDLPLNSLETFFGPTMLCSTVVSTSI